MIKKLNYSDSNLWEFWQYGTVPNFHTIWIDDKNHKIEIRYNRKAQIIKEAEIIHVEPERSVITEIDQVFTNFIHVRGFAVRRQAHQFILPGIYLESGEIRESGIEQAERVRKTELAHEFDCVVTSAPQRTCSPFPHPVYRQDARAFERRWEKSTRGMGLMMVGKVHCGWSVDPAFFQTIG